MADFIYDPSLVLYIPLHQLDGSLFMSQDAYGHLCTVTGAAWTLQGYDFDGTDDKIDCGSNTILDNLFDGGGTVLAWINVDTDGENSEGRIFDKAVRFYTSGESGANVKLSFYIITDTTDGQWDTTTTAVIRNRWEFVVVV